LILSISSIASLAVSPQKLTPRYTSSGGSLSIIGLGVKSDVDNKMASISNMVMKRMETCFTDIL
jgi:hypothetical protein